MRSVLIPNLMVEDVASTVRFYQDVLNFELQMGVEPVDNAPPNFVTELTKDMMLEWANMTGLGAEVMFQERNSFTAEVPALEGAAIGASQTLYFRIEEDIDAHYENIKDKVTVVVEPTTKFYGMREWYMKDCNGYILCFGQQVEME